jgi:hypothetical protein
MNPFIKGLRDGRIAGEDGLRRLFWKLAVKTHPDSAACADDGSAFIRLKAAHDEALAWLRSPAPLAAGAPLRQSGSCERPSAPARVRFLRLFSELMASDFPANQTVRQTSRAYRLRLEACASIWDSELAATDAAFVRIETELCRLRGPGRIHQPPFGLVKLIMYSVCSYHFCGFAYLRPAIRRWREEILPQLDPAQYGALRVFLEWLVADLEQGPAIAD